MSALRSKCAGAPSDAPARDLLHESGYLLFGWFVDDGDVTGEDSVETAVAGFGAGLDFDLRPRLPRAFPASVAVMRMR